jgi:hypothetical protein
MEDEESRVPHLLRFLVNNDQTTESGSDSKFYIIPLGSAILNFLLTRVRNEMRTQPSVDDLASYERRLRRRRNIALDENGESDEETIGLESREYVDFRTYPLTIGWKDLFSFKSDTCRVFLYLDEIMFLYGYVGVFLYEGIQDLKDLNIKPEEFIENILDYYFNKDICGFKSTLRRRMLIDKFPKITTLNKLLSLDLLSKREILIAKIILDIYLCYNKCENTLNDEIFEIIILFYLSLSKDDYKSLLSRIKQNQKLKAFYCKN